MDTPVLVRVRLTDIARAEFVQEANAATTIETSAIEKARLDADFSHVPAPAPTTVKLTGKCDAEVCQVNEYPETYKIYLER